MKAIQTKIPEVIDVDLCVVGCGGAGLTAAVGALESGIGRICIIEKTPRTGGTTRLPGGMCAFGTKLQASEGCDSPEYTPDRAFVNHMDRTMWECDAKLVRKWYQNTSANIDWLTEKGLNFTHLLAFSGTTKTHHMVEDRNTGNAIVNAMLKELQEHDVDIYTHTRGTQLILDDAGKVVGVRAEHDDGTQVTIHARAVVLSTGSIAFNDDLVARFYPGEDMSKVKIMSKIPHNTGDGLLMAEAIGASTSYISTMFIGPQNHDSNMRISNIVRRPQIIKVNRNGERFADEGLPMTRDWGWYLSLAVDRQPGKVVYSIFDQSILDDMVIHNPVNMCYNEEFMGNLMEHDTVGAMLDGRIAEVKKTDLTAWLKKIPEDIQAEVDGGRAIVADTLEEVAAWIGADPEVLKQTVVTYNESCAMGYDQEMLKDPRFLQPLTKAPYYVLRSYSGIDTCIGGLRINSEMQVVDKEIKPIPGLYGAGVLTSGWLSHAYAYFGSECSFTVFSGRFAGIHAAEYIMRNEE